MTQTLMRCELNGLLQHAIMNSLHADHGETF